MAIKFGPDGAYDDRQGMLIENPRNPGSYLLSDGVTPYNPLFGYATQMGNTALGPAEYKDGYIVRGDYRMPIQEGAKQGGGQLEYRGADGNWSPVGAGVSGYDPRQDSEAQGSNERLSFDWAFANAPAGSDIGNLQQIAINSGWTEPDRSQNDGTLGSMLSSVIPGALAMYGGINALGGLFGGGGLANNGFIDALGGMTDATGTALPGWSSGATSASGITGAAAGSGGNMNWFDQLKNGVSDFFGGPSGGAKEFTSSIANSADPIEAMYQTMQATGTTSATEAASALGFNSAESMLAAINPAWVGTSLGTMLNNAGQVIKGASGAAGAAGGGTSLLGAGIGGLAGLLNGSKQAGTTTTTTEPWAGQQPFLLDAFNKAKAASGGSPIQTQANANYQSVLSGPTTNPMLGMDNPYLTKAIDNANSDVNRAMMPAMDQANRASGSFGNSGVADTFGKSLTDAYSRNATGMRMQDYTNQQQLQQQAVQNNLGLTTGANTFAAQPSQNYAQTVQGNYGQTQTSPYFTNPFAGFAGGAAIGSKIGANLGF